MYLLQVRLVGVGPFEDVSFPFADEEGEPRLMTVVHGGGGVGKTTLLAALAATRPGHATVLGRGMVAEGEEPAPAYASCLYRLGQDDPERPHALNVASPNARVFADDEAEAFRRREQAAFDKRARLSGHAFLAIGSTRWFSRQPIAIHAPARTVARYDVRAAAGLDDASRSDLARETKQALAYAAIASAMAPGARGKTDLEVLGRAMHAAVDRLVQLAGFSYTGVDPFSFEPTFLGQEGRVRPFDALPTRARHLVAFAALPVRTLWAAYPSRDPRMSEAVVVIDEIDLHQDPGVQAELVGALRAALPKVQWIVTTTSPTLAGSCNTREVLALRRLPDEDRVALYTGAEARTH